MRCLFSTITHSVKQAEVFARCDKGVVRAFCRRCMYEKVVYLRFTDLVLNLNYYLKTIYLLGGYIIKERFQRISRSRLWDRCNVYIFFTATVNRR